MEGSQKRVSPMLAVLLAICILFSSVPPTAYAMRDNGSAETAVMVAPKQLKLDGSESYVIFTGCVWGAHTYGIGPDALATEDLEISTKNRTPGTAVHLAQAGLGWTLTQTQDGLFIERQGRYLTVSADQTCLFVSDRAIASGLAIAENGVLGLASGANKTVYLQRSDRDPEPKPGQQFLLTDQQNATVFYFAKVQESVAPSADVLFPTLLPQKNFRAKIVPPDQVYGDDQYVIFTVSEGRPVAITSNARRSAPLKPDEAIAVGVTVSSPDQNTLWTVNNNREKPAESGYYKYIRSCASNQYLAANASLLDQNAKCDFYLADKDGSSALIATGNGRYVTLNGDTFGVTNDRNAASRFYFAKLLLDEQQKTGSTVEIPRGNLLRLVDWNSIQQGKTYAIISATELNKMHYALSGNGRLARYGADNLTQHSLCPNENVTGPYGTPCQAATGDVFYTNGQDILWTASVPGANRAIFRNINTNLYLKPSEGTAAEQTPSVSSEAAVLAIEPVDGQAYAYLRGDGGKYLGIWQYISVGVDRNATERCAYYLAEALDTDNIKDLPATALEKDYDQSTVSFGGLYSIYQGSQHLLTEATGVESFILMDDGNGSFKPSSPEYNTDGKNNYYVTYCADWNAEMPIFTDPGQYKAVRLEDYDGFTAGQKATLAAIMPHCYPYVTKDAFLNDMKKAGYEVSKDCGIDEILAGVQAVIYTITNPREDGQAWGYESSDGWAHNSFEVNKPNSYVADPAQAGQDVNTVRDYLWSFATPAAASSATMLRSARAADDGYTELEGDYFAITTEINGHTWALGYPSGSSRSCVLMPYNSEDIRQMWCIDENGSLRWLPHYINHDKKTDDLPVLYIYKYKTSSSDSSYFAWNDYYAYTGGWSCYGYFPFTLDEANGRLLINDYKEKLSNFPWPVNKLLNIEVDSYDLEDEETLYNNGGTMYLDVNSVFTDSTNKLIFKKEHVTPRFPHFIDYTIKDSDWTITQGNGTYNAKVTGNLSFSPIREELDRIGVLMAPESEFADQYYNIDSWQQIVPVAAGEKDFTIQADNVSDSEETHFCLRIDQSYMGVAVFAPENPGWQLQLGMLFNEAIKEIHEITTSIPVKKTWEDNKDHSGDKAELCLVENGKDTSYKITLDEKNDWQGEFKHVPFERWTYNIYGQLDQRTKIPLKSHEYTVKELNVKPGYTPTYDDGMPEEPEEPVDPLMPGKSYPVQAVYTPENGDAPMAFDLLNGFTEYALGNKDQLYFLNGGNVLVFKIEEVHPDITYYGYMNLYYEKADEEGKFNLYIIYPDNPEEKYYLSLDNERPFVPSKSEAVDFEFRHFDTGEALKAVPTDAFQSFTTAFLAYFDGLLTDAAFDIDQDGGFGQYDAGNMYQQFRVCCYDGQVVAYINLIPDLFLLPEACSDIPGQYVLGTPNFEDGTIEYLGFKRYEGLVTVGNPQQAMRFGMTAFPAGAAPDAVPPSFTVTNVPNPEIPHTGDSANTALWLVLLTVSGLALVTLAVVRRKRQGKEQE